MDDITTLHIGDVFPPPLDETASTALDDEAQATLQLDYPVWESLPGTKDHHSSGDDALQDDDVHSSSEDGSQPLPDSDTESDSEDSKSYNTSSDTIGRITPTSTSVQVDDEGEWDSSYTQLPGEVEWESGYSELPGEVPTLDFRSPLPGHSQRSFIGGIEVDPKYDFLVRFLQIPRHMNGNFGEMHRFLEWTMHLLEEGAFEFVGRIRPYDLCVEGEKGGRDLPDPKWRQHADEVQIQDWARHIQKYYITRFQRVLAGNNINVNGLERLRLHAVHRWEYDSDMIRIAAGFLLMIKDEYRLEILELALEILYMEHCDPEENTEEERERLRIALRVIPTEPETLHQVLCQVQDLVEDTCFTKQSRCNSDLLAKLLRPADEGTPASYGWDCPERVEQQLWCSVDLSWCSDPFSGGSCDLEAASERTISQLLRSSRHLRNCAAHRDYQCEGSLLAEILANVQTLVAVLGNPTAAEKIEGLRTKGFMVSIYAKQEAQRVSDLCIQEEQVQDWQCEHHDQQCAQEQDWQWEGQQEQQHEPRWQPRAVDRWRLLRVVSRLLKVRTKAARARATRKLRFLLKSRRGRLRLSQSSSTTLSIDSTDTEWVDCHLGIVTDIGTIRPKVDYAALNPAPFEWLMKAAQMRKRESHGGLVRHITSQRVEGIMMLGDHLGLPPKLTVYLVFEFGEEAVMALAQRWIAETTRTLVRF